jgi:hypothetical protein
MEGICLFRIQDFNYELIIGKDTNLRRNGH